MGNHPVVPHGDAQSADEIEDAAHGPVQPGIAMNVAEERHPDEGRQRDQREQRCRRDIQRSPAVLCGSIQVMAHGRTLFVTTQVFRLKGLEFRTPAFSLNPFSLST